MEFFVQLLFVVHLVSMVAGGANGVIQAMTGLQVPLAGPDTRAVLYRMQDRAETMGKVAMASLILSGLLMLWLKWNATAPNAWFWLKMVGLAGMLLFIALAAKQTEAARSGGPQAPKAIAMKVFCGKMIFLSFLVVLVGAALTFN